MGRLILKGPQGGLYVITASGKKGKPAKKKAAAAPKKKAAAAPKKKKAASKANVSQCVRIPDNELSKMSGGAKRGAPPFHARPCAGTTKKGIDGRMWESRRTKTSWRWMLAGQQTASAARPAAAATKQQKASASAIQGVNLYGRQVWKSPRGRLFVTVNKQGVPVNKQERPAFLPGYPREKFPKMYNSKGRQQGPLYENFNTWRKNGGVHPWQKQKMTGEAMSPSPSPAPVPKPQSGRNGILKRVTASPSTATLANLRNLANLAYETPANRKAIAASGVIPLLVGLLDTRSTEKVQEAVCTALSNLAFGSTSNRRAIAAAGAIPRLYLLIGRAGNNTYLREAAQNLLNTLATQASIAKNIKQQRRSIARKQRKMSAALAAPLPRPSALPSALPVKKLWGGYNPWD